MSTSMGEYGKDPFWSMRKDDESADLKGPAERIGIEVHSVFGCSFVSLSSVCAEISF